MQEPLGRGGQGAVFRAWDPNLKRMVALKLMHGGRDENEQILEEAQSGAQVIHPHVVTIFGASTWNAQVVIAMEYLPRGSLRAWIAEERRPIEHIVARFLEAARGLAAIHAAKLVHRDFKPDNVLLKENGSAAVADFGLARAQANGGESRSGTRHYMAPELRGLGAATTASDQYAFCVSLFWALTRTYPQEGREVFFPPEVPAWLRKIISRGLQRVAADRYESMDALIADLENTPEVQRRALLRTLAVVGGLGALLAAGLIVKFSESPGERALRECTERVQTAREQLWSPRQVDKMQKNFTALAGTVGTQTFERVRARVEPQVDAWARASTAACTIKERGARRNTESCLAERRAVLAALTDFLATTQEPGTMRDVAPALSRELKPVESCAQSAVVAVDKEETDAERALRSRLARALVERAAGRFSEAQNVVQAVLVESEPHARVNAEATLLDGQLMSDLGLPEAAERLHLAINLAEAVGADELRARGWTTLISFHSRRLQLALASEAEQHATAVIERLGRPPLLLGPLLNGRGTLELARKDLDKARENFLAQQKLLLASYDANDPAVFRARNNVLLTSVQAEQVPGFQQLLAETERELGEAHLETLFTRRNLAGALLRNKDCSLAEAHVTDIITTRAAGPAHLQAGLAGDYSLRARARMCLKKYDDALVDQQTSLSLLGRPSNEVRARELLFLYEVLKAAGKSKAELDAVLSDRCKIGFGPPDGTGCPTE
ncbi:MAG: protein kinase [Archangium sp.]|nr:protein kinase [Archangium sp.]